MPIISISFLKHELKQHENRVASEDKTVDAGVDISPLKQFIEALSEEKDRELTSAEQLRLADIVLKHPLKEGHLFFNIGQKFKTSSLFLDGRLSYDLMTNNLFVKDGEIDYEGMGLYATESKLKESSNKTNMTFLKTHFEAYEALSFTDKEIIIRYLQVCILSSEDELLSVLNHIDTLKRALKVLNEHKLEDDKYLLALQKNIVHADDMAYILMHLDHVKLIPRFYDLACRYAGVIDVISKAREKITWKIGLLATQEDWIELFPLLCEGATFDGFLDRLTTLATTEALNRHSFIALINELTKELKVSFLLAMKSGAGAESPVRTAFSQNFLYEPIMARLIFDFTFFNPNKPKLKTEIEEKSEPSIGSKA